MDGRCRRIAEVSWPQNEGNRKGRNREEYRYICSLDVFKARLQSSSTPNPPARTMGPMRLSYSYMESPAARRQKS